MGALILLELTPGRWTIASIESGSYRPICELPTTWTVARDKDQAAIHVPRQDVQHWQSSAERILR